MNPKLKSRILGALRDDMKRFKGLQKHPETVLLHLTPEQVSYLRSKKVEHSHRGLGSYMRRLLIIDMERQRWREENAADKSGSRTERR